MFSANDTYFQSEQLKQQQDSRLPWIVCFSAALFFFYEFIQGNMFSSIAPDLMRAFHVNAEQLGQLSGVYYLANVIFLFPAGILLDRISTKKIICVSLLICIFGTMLFSMAHSYWVAYLCRFLTGIGSAFCFLSCIRLASRWFPPRRLALISGLIVTMAMLGGMVAQTPLTLLVLHVGWREALIYDALLGIFFLFVIMRYVRDFPVGQQQQSKTDVDAIGIWSSLRQSYFKLQNWLCAIYTSTLNIPVGVFGAFAGGIFLMQADHLSRTQASLVTSMIFIGTTIGGPVVGWISDRMARRRMPMIIGALISMAIVLAIIYTPQLSFSALMMLFLLLGFFTSTQVISYPTVAESNSLALTATSVSVVSIFTQGGTAFYQPLFGYLLQTAWHGQYINNVPFYSIAAYHRALLMLPAGFAIAIVAAFFVKETYGKRQQQDD